MAEHKTNTNSRVFVYQDLKEKHMSKDELEFKQEMEGMGYKVDQIYEELFEKSKLSHIHSSQLSQTKVQRRSPLLLKG